MRESQPKRALFSRNQTELVSAKESISIPSKRASVQLETSPFTETLETKPIETEAARTLLTTVTEKASVVEDATQFETSREFVPGQIQTERSTIISKSQYN